MYDWRWGLGITVMVVVAIALVVSVLTARNRSYVDTKRTLQRRRFRPDWNRNRPDASARRRGVHLRR
jgi:hypothetical protein